MNLLPRIANAMIQMLFPAICPVCRSLFHMPESKYIHHTFKAVIPEDIHSRNITFQKIMSSYLCPKCLSETFIPAESPRCSRCGMIFREENSTDHLCARCLNSPPKFRIARSFGVYDPLFRECIHAFKYRKKIRLRKPLGILLFLAFLRNWHPQEIDVIVPVPLHARRMRERGFNQVYLMLRDWHQIAARFHTDISHIRIEREGLIRIRSTETQVGMTREERIANLSNAFEVPYPDRIAGKRILLADDVLTTGSTANQCAELLLDKGKATRTDVLTLAQTLRKNKASENYTPE